MNFSLKSLDVRSESFEFGLSRHWLLEEHFNPLESFLLVVELTADNFVAQLSVCSGLAAQVVQHLLGTEILPCYLLGVHQSLAD